MQSIPNPSIGQFDGILIDSIEFSPAQPVPEPASILSLLALGLFGVDSAWQHQQKQVED